MANNFKVAAECLKPVAAPNIVMRLWMADRFEILVEGVFV